MKLVKIGMLVLKLMVTSLLLWFLFRKSDFGSVAKQIDSLNIFFAAIALSIMVAQLILTGVRWYFVEKILGAGIKAGISIRLILIGQFFNQVLPSSVGGDGVRAWLLTREKLSISRALRSVICDRVVALAVLTVIAVSASPLLVLSISAAIPSVKPIAFAIALLVLGGLLFLFLLGEAFSSWLIRIPAGRPFAVIVRDLRHVLFSSRKSLWVVGLSILVQALLVLCIYFLALALRVELDATQLLMLPLIMLLSSIPISFAGWGLRESVMVAGFGFVGVSTGDALAVSVSFGIAQMLIGLPGLVLTVISIYEYKQSKDRLEISAEQDGW